jgi:hypothetical protein
LKWRNARNGRNGALQPATEVTMARLKGVEVAAALGVNKSTVSRQARAWKLVGADGLIDLDEYRARRERELNPLMSREPAAEAPAAQPAGPTVASANAERTALQAELLRLKLDREAGKQLDAAAVASEVAEAGGVFRAALGALPSKLALDLARESDPEAVERRLALAFDELLRDLDGALAEAMDAARDEAQEAEEET